MDLTVHNNILLEIWWNMLIKFIRQIGKSPVKMINRKMNSRPCQTSEMELFPQVFSGFTRNSESCQRAFCKHSQKRKAGHYFCKKPHHGCLTRFWICFWTGFQSYGCFIFKSVWISKVTDNLLGKLLKLVERKCCSTELIFEPYVAHSNAS